MAHRNIGVLLFTALVLAGCGGGETASGTTGGSGGGGSGGGGSGGGGSGGGGSGGSSTTTSGCSPCPTGSHETAECACAADLVEWTTGPLLGSARDHHVTFAAPTASGRFLYAAAGASSLGAPLTSVERASIGEDGSLGPFEKIAPLPVGLIGPGFAQVGNGFVIGGGLTKDGNSTADTWVGVVADDGSLAYSAGPPLTIDRYHLTLVAGKGFVFAIGGLEQVIENGTPKQTILDVVERASFDGEVLSAFEQIGTLPEPTTHHTAFFHEDALYVLGGGSGASARTDILRATVSDAGEVGTWEVVGQLPEARATASAAVFLDQLYVFAGMKSLIGDERDTVLRAPIEAAGNVGAFEELAPLPKARAHSHQTPLLDGFFYSVGGSINHAPQKDVYVGKLQ